MIMGRSGQIELCKDAFQRGRTALIADNPKEAERCFREVSKTAREDDALFDFLIPSLFNLGLALQKQSKDELALNVYTELFVCTPRLEESEVLQMEDGMADVLIALKHYRRAIPFCEDSIRLSARLQGENMDYALRYHRLARCYMSNGLYAHAIPVFSKCHDLLAALAGGQDPMIGAVDLDWGNALSASKDNEGAAAMLERVVDFATRIGDNDQLALARRNLAIPYMNLGRYQEAESLLEGQTTLVAQLNRGELHRCMKKFPEARFFIQSTMDAANNSHSEMLAVCYETMGEIEEECGDFPAAARWFTRAREKHQQCVSPNFSDLKCAHENEARALGRIGDKEGAIKAKNQVDLLERVMSMVPPPNRNLHIPAGAIDPDQPINESTVIFGTRYGDEWAISELWGMKGYRGITSFMNRILKSANLPHDAACAGLVAAAVVACGAGHELDETTDDIKDWVAGRRKAPSSTDVATARRLVDRILRESETRDIWKMAGKLDEWSAVLRKLQAGLIP